MNKINLYKQIAACVLMILTMVTFSYINTELYQAVTFFIGCWAVGAFCGNLARDKWPLYEEKQNDD